MWVIAFKYDGTLIEIAASEDEAEARLAFGRLQKIHEEAVGYWHDYQRDESSEPILDRFAEKSPAHAVAEQHCDARLLLFKRKDPPSIKDSPLAELLHGGK